MFWEEWNLSIFYIKKISADWLSVPKPQISSNPNGLVVPLKDLQKNYPFTGSFMVDMVLTSLTKKLPSYALSLLDPTGWKEDAFHHL